MPCKATRYVDNDSHHTAGNVRSPASQKDCFNEAGLELYCRSSEESLWGRRNRESELSADTARTWANSRHLPRPWAEPEPDPSPGP